MKRMKEHHPSLIDKEQPDFRTESPCTDHIIPFRIIVEQCAEIQSCLLM